MKVVDGALEVSHEAVHISNDRVGWGVLRDENQGLAVVLQRLDILPIGEQKQQIGQFSNDQSQIKGSA